jgi:hypothetical protein
VILDGHELDRAVAASLVRGDYGLAPVHMGRMTGVVGPERCREAFSAFRKTVRPNMLWGPFVSELTFELFDFTLTKHLRAGNCHDWDEDRPGLDGGAWGDAETGTCSWGEQVPTYRLGRWASQGCQHH